MRKPKDRTETEKRIREVMEAYGISSKSALSRELGVAMAVLNNWCYRDHVPHNMTIKMAEKLVDLNPRYVEYGIGNLKLTQPVEHAIEVTKSTIEQRPHVRPNSDTVVIDIPHRISRYPINLVTSEQINKENATMMAEDFFVTCGDVDLEQVSETLVPIHLPGGCAKYMFGCKGVSMEPRLHEGDYIGVNETMSKYEKFDPERMYLIFTKTGKAMVKYVEDPGPEYDYLQLRTLNENYKLDDNGRLLKEDFRAACKIVVIVSWL